MFLAVPTAQILGETSIRHLERDSALNLTCVVRRGSNPHQEVGVDGEGHYQLIQWLKNDKVGVKSFSSCSHFAWIVLRLGNGGPFNILYKGD